MEFCCSRESNDHEHLSIIKIIESYKQGFCIVIVSFDLLEARPGFLLMHTETNKVEYIKKEFMMDIAKAKGALMVMADQTVNLIT